MSALNLKEIPPAHSGADRDRFEIFAREFMAAKGFRVITHPDRGADGGRDLLLEEDRSGPGGTTTIRWLVSCKHKAHSGSSVQPADDENIHDRLATHDCQGFISFYSTVPSSGLANTLNKLKPKFEYLPFDPGSIERFLLETPEGRSVASRFMPISYGGWLERSRNLPPGQTGKSQEGMLLHYLRQPHMNYRLAMAECRARNRPLLAVIYKHEHPTFSRLSFALSYFMELPSTKKLVDTHFVNLVAPAIDPDVTGLVPIHDNLEHCLMVVLGPDGSLIARETVYANPEIGLERLREWIEMFDEYQIGSTITLSNVCGL
ncbi:restriction endonuclease [Rhizobium leguminosarum]|uniref:restriction endonuclease n=1 Tax=Rhizobium leguminosarum TaxID=384 RepID=UPI0013BD9C93|nr:restriction endonuclease [Rhizobium leguminosarum]NEI62158.1 hypothetical protein [Rhizobium leguminosarum]